MFWKRLGFLEKSEIFEEIRDFLRNVVYLEKSGIFGEVTSIFEELYDS